MKDPDAPNGTPEDRERVASIKRYTRTLPDTRTCYFDLVVKLEADGKKAKDGLVAAMQQRFPGFAFDVQVETDYAE